MEEEEEKEEEERGAEARSKSQELEEELSRLELQLDNKETELITSNCLVEELRHQVQSRQSSNRMANLQLPKDLTIQRTCSYTHFRRPAVPLSPQVSELERTMAEAEAEATRRILESRSRQGEEEEGEEEGQRVAKPGDGPGGPQASRAFVRCI